MLLFYGGNLPCMFYLDHQMATAIPELLNNTKECLPFYERNPICWDCGSSASESDDNFLLQPKLSSQWPLTLTLREQGCQREGVPVSVSVLLSRARLSRTGRERDKF